MKLRKNQVIMIAVLITLVVSLFLNDIIRIPLVFVGVLTAYIVMKRGEKMKNHE